MRSVLLAAALLSACAHGPAKLKEPAPLPRDPVARASYPKIAVLAPEQPPMPEGTAPDSLVSTFEELFCVELSHANNSEVVCSSDLRAFAQMQQRQGLMSGQGSNGMPDITTLGEAERTLAVNYEPSTRVINLTLLRTADHQVLGRFSTVLKPDGGDLLSRANEVAFKIAAVP